MEKKRRYSVLFIILLLILLIAVYQGRGEKTEREHLLVYNLKADTDKWIVENQYIIKGNSTRHFQGGFIKNIEADDIYYTFIDATIEIYNNKGEYLDTLSSTSVSSNVRIKLYNNILNITSVTGPANSIADSIEYGNLDNYDIVMKLIVEDGDRKYNETIKLQPVRVEVDKVLDRVEK